MNNVINIIAQDHKKWVRIANSFGTNGNAEDIVQGKYNKTLMFNETEVNHYFVFKVLRNIYLDEVKKKKRIIYTDDNYIEPSVCADSFEYDEMLQEVRDEIKDWHLYEIKIYELIFLEGWNMTQLSNKTGINYHSIRRTVLKIKNTLNNKIR